MSQLGGSPQCILLVDDEPHLVCVVRMYLELHGFFELALRELKTSAAYVSDYAALLEVHLAQECVFSELRQIARQVRLHAELLADLIDDVPLR